MHPRITFRVSSRRDIETFRCFLNDVAYDKGRALEQAVFRQYPSLKRYRKSSTSRTGRRGIERFVLSTYKKRRLAIHRTLTMYRRNWNRIEAQYYTLVDELFNPRFWPKGKYIAYSTVWGMFARFLSDKTFQIPAYRHRRIKYVNVIIAHELLHFIFYNYFFRTYPQYRNEKHEIFVWHVSEIFNAIVQNSPRWLSIFGMKSMVYPQHKKIVKRLERKYHRRLPLSVTALAEDIMKVAKNLKLS